MALKLKGSTTGTSTRISRTPEFKATVLARMANGDKAKDALVFSCDEFEQPVNASYTNKYSFEASGSSAITTKFVAVPPPTILTTILGNMAQEQADKPDN